MKGYGQIFLLLLAIGLIFLATSGKGFAVWQVLSGKGAGSGGAGGAGGIPPNANPTDPKKWVEEKDKAKSGSGGVLA
jgi:hypothetical protein